MNKTAGEAACDRPWIGRSRPFFTFHFSLFTLIFLLAIPAVSDPLLTLAEALRLAMENNREYRMAVADQEIAANNVSWGDAGALPKADLTAAYNESLTDTPQERLNAAEETRNGAKSTSATAGVSASWTVFEGLTSLAAHARLAALAKSASLRREEVRQALAALVITGYGDVVRQKRLHGALDSAVALSRERVKITEGKYRLGSLSKLELLQARIDLNEDLSAQLRQRLALGNSKRGLNRVLAREEAAAFEVADSVALGALPDFQGLRAAALEANPALLQSAQGKRLAALGLREYVGGLFPKMALSAGYNYGLSESEAGFIKANEALGWTYGVNLRFNLFDGFAANRSYRNARLSLSKAELRYGEVRAGVEAGLAEAHAAYAASLEVLALESENLGLAKENVAVAMERLRLGTIASLELRAAQEDYLAAETRLVTARFECKRSETELLRLAGKLAP